MRLEEFLEGMLDETREEISRSDSKSSILLAAAGVASAALGGGFISSDLTLDGKSQWLHLLVVSVAISLLLGIFLLGAAVFPRVGRPEKGRARYFREHAQYQHHEELKKALEREAADPADRHVQQLSTLAKIAVRKYRLTQAGQLAMGVGFALTALAVILDQL